jgi:hypothetical protein
MNLTSPRVRPAVPPVTLTAVLSAVAVFALLVAADQISIPYGLQESQRVFDDLCGGIIAGALVFRHERARRRQLAERLHTIASMNHHVRNALQVIMYSAYVPSDQEQLGRIRDAVERIEWALQEVLPGESLNDDDDWRPKTTTQREERSSAA